MFQNRTFSPIARNMVGPFRLTIKNYVTFLKYYMDSIVVSIYPFTYIGIMGSRVSHSGSPKAFKRCDFSGAESQTTQKTAIEKQNVNTLPLFVSFWRKQPPQLSSYHQNLDRFPPPARSLRLHLQGKNTVTRVAVCVAKILVSRFSHHISLFH